MVNSPLGSITHSLVKGEFSHFVILVLYVAIDNTCVIVASYSSSFLLYASFSSSMCCKGTLGLLYMCTVYVEVDHQRRHGLMRCGG